MLLRFETFEEAKRHWANAKTPETAKKLLGSITFGEVMRTWQSDVLSSYDGATQISYSKHLKHFEFFDALQMDKISSQVVDQWLAFIKTPEYLSRGRASRLSSMTAAP